MVTALRLQETTATLQEAAAGVQEGGAAVPVWVEWSAAVATVLTLILVVAFRLWDSRTRMNIVFKVGEHPAGASETQERWIHLDAVNNSRMPLFPADAYLETGNGQRLQPMQQAIPGWGADVLQPGSPATYSYSMSQVAEFLMKQGFKSKAEITFVVRDGTGRRHEKRLVVTDLEIWARGGEGRQPLHTRS